MRITRPFYVGIYEVTQGEYEQVMGSNPSAFTAKQMDASAFKPVLNEADIIEGMEENLCRCGAHQRIVQAIQSAAKQMRG